MKVQPDADLVEPCAPLEQFDHAPNRAEAARNSRTNGEIHDQCSNRHKGLVEFVNKLLQ